MNAAGAIGGVVAGVVVLMSSYAALCAVALLPVVALGVSFLFEKYAWTGMTTLGVGLSVLGNIAMLRKTSVAATA